jgi:hypothetical protein
MWGDFACPVYVGVMWKMLINVGVINDRIEQRSDAFVFSVKESQVKFLELVFTRIKVKIVYTKINSIIHISCAYRFVLRLNASLLTVALHANPTK